MRDRGPDLGEAAPGAGLTRYPQLACTFPITVELRGDPASIDLDALGSAAEQALTDRLRFAADRLGGGPLTVVVATGEETGSTVNVIAHLPAVPTVEGALPDAIRGEVERVLRAAVRRALDAVATAAPAPAGGVAATDVVPTGPTRAGRARVPVRRRAAAAPGRHRPAQPPAGPAEKRPVPAAAAAGYRIVKGASPVDGQVVLLCPRVDPLPDVNDVKLGGADRYIEATSFTAALQLGLAVFGRRSFAILKGPFGEPDARFWVVATDKVVDNELLGRSSAPTVFAGERVAAFSAAHLLLSAVDDRWRRTYAVETLVTAERDWLVRPSRAAVERLKGLLSQGGPGLSRQQRREAVFAEIDLFVAAALAGDRDKLATAAGRLAELDVAAFALVELNTKVDYLKVLILASTTEPKNRAIVEIMRSLRSTTELQVVKAMLIVAGLFDQLFNDLGTELWDLLVTVGERFGDPAPLTFAAFLDLVCDVFTLPRSLDEAIRQAVERGQPVNLALGVRDELQAAVRAGVGFLVKIWDTLKMVMTRPLKILDGLAQLVRLMVTVELARYGDTEALAEVKVLLGKVGSKLLDGFKGTAVLGVGDQVVTTIKWAIIVEVASWFVGVGEVKAAASAVGLTEKVGAVLRFLRVLGKVGETAEVEIVAARLARVAAAMREGSEILKGLKGEDDVLALLAHLPEEDVVRFGQMLERVDVAADASLAGILAHPELGSVAADSLRKVEILQTLAGKAGGLSEGVASVFRRLAGGGRAFHIDELAEVVAAIKNGEGARFLATLECIGLERIGPRSVVREDFLKLIAADAARMNAIGEYGYEVVRGLANWARGNAEALDKILGRLSRLQATMTGEGRVVEFRKLLDALVEGDPAAWTRILTTRRRETLQTVAEIAAPSPAAQQGLRKLVQGGHAEVSEFLARESLRDVDRARTVQTLERLAELNDRQVEGFAAVMRLPRADLGGGMEREAILALDKGMRDPLLELVGEVHGSVDAGLDAAIRRGLQGSKNDIQGTLGHFHAARTLKERFPGARLRFEVRAPNREVDIHVAYRGRTLDVEVKTNLGGGPTVKAEQIEKDLLRHAGDRWQDLQYLYAPQQAENLDQVERGMRAALRRLDKQGRLPMSLADAEAALAKRLATEPPWKFIDVFTY